MEEDIHTVIIVFSQPNTRVVFAQLEGLYHDVKFEFLDASGLVTNPGRISESSVIRLTGTKSALQKLVKRLEPEAREINHSIALIKEQCD